MMHSVPYTRLIRLAFPFDIKSLLPVAHGVATINVLIRSVDFELTVGCKEGVGGAPYHKTGEDASKCVTNTLSFEQT